MSWLKESLKEKQRQLQEEAQRKKLEQQRQADRKAALEELAKKAQTLIKDWEYLQCDRILSDIVKSGLLARSDEDGDYEVGYLACVFIEEERERHLYWGRRAYIDHNEGWTFIPDTSHPVHKTIKDALIDHTRLDAGKLTFSHVQRSINYVYWLQDMEGVDQRHSSQKFSLGLGGDFVKINRFEIPFKAFQRTRDNIRKIVDSQLALYL